MRIALLSNVTIDLLAGMVKKNNEVYLSAGFDTWQQEIIIPTSGLYDFKPEAIIILLHSGAYEWKDKEYGCQLIDEWCDSINVLLSTIPGVPVFVSSLDIKSICNYGSEIRIEEYLENYLIESVQKLHKSGSSIYILPVKECVLDLGRKNFYSAKMWYVGSMPYSMKGLSALNDLITQYTSVSKGMHKKCIAVDLDNTLWGGVIGEDGVDGIVLSNHKEGARYYDAQLILKKMKEQGVMLAVLSKNNVEDVETVYSHPHMILQHDDFVSEIIDWNPKSTNIRQMAKSLNIGLDSFVFLDDNPAEREQMIAECPEVTVIDFPKDSSLLPDVLEQVYYEYFLSLDVTGEDTKKTAMYKAESLRKAEMSSSASVEDFLKKLEMTMSIHYMLPEEEKRVVQLVNKTNQFNLTTKRYSEEEIKTLAQNGDIITVHMADKYGDQGLVSVIILTYDDTIAEIDSFLMSCRVMGRNAEYEMLSRIKNMLKSKNIVKLKSSYSKTAKNTPVNTLYEKLGFDLISGNEDEKFYEILIDKLPNNTGVFKDVLENLE